MGFHIEHVNSFNPIFRATRSYAELAAKADFLKIVVYNNCGGERYADFIKNVCATVFRDVPQEELLRFNNHLLNYGERSRNGWSGAGGPFRGLRLSRNATRAGGVQGKCKILPGIDIGIPTGQRQPQGYAGGHLRRRRRRPQSRSRRPALLAQILRDATGQSGRRRPSRARLGKLTMCMDESPTIASGQTRREFLKKTVGATVVGAAGNLLDGCASVSLATKPTGANLPWHRRVLRWGQTNITEIDPTRYDIAWWRQYWKRTCTQGVIINAGGIVAYYPSKFPLHHQAEFLNGRDLYGELAAAAHADGLAVLARMDSNRAHADFHRAHPDWFAVDGDGQPYRAGELYVACINSPYYEEYLPGVLREIIERTRPEGFADNSWSGLDRNSICHCENCTRRFRAEASHDLPREKDWNSPVYRQWIQWNYARRLEIWDMNNRVTKVGGRARLSLDWHE